jgi:hypothetical protein
MRLSDCVGKRVSVFTAHTHYQFDIFALDDIHGEAFDLRGGETTKYLDGRHSDVEIKGTKLARVPLAHAIAIDKFREGHLITGGFLYFRYAAHPDFITTSGIEQIEVVPLPENPIARPH